MKTILLAILVIMTLGFISCSTPQTEVKEEVGVLQQLSSGLQYIDRVIGKGPMPEKGDVVQVHYTGTLADGTKFDSSLDRGQPFSFPLGEGKVIKGWDEGLSTMRVGGKRQLIIPPDLGYGTRKSGPIPPNSTLYFEVELLHIRKK